MPNTISNLHHKIFKVGADSLKIDSVSIIPNSLSIVSVPASDYRIDYINAEIHWIKKPLLDNVTITYRSFPFQLNFVTQRIKLDSILKNLYTIPYQFNNNLSDDQKGIFNFGTLKADGSFGRQIAFGNSQDAVLNSSLNLQLSGLLGDSIEIKAAITDNNIPIQPDGTTQQLNEFDQVFLQFKKRGWQLDLGDIDIRQNQSYFLNFYQRLQGISFQTTNRISKNVVSKTLASGSIAKGKFARDIITALEGNQGPYRLTDPNNDLFFIVLANTERVFLDGQMLQRGQDQDYVINYNTAEVTFTPKIMITKDSRIQIEFEYADRNYLNSNLYLSQEFDFKKNLKLNIGIFNNSDAKNSQINQPLNSNQIQFLAGVGDSIQKAYYPSAALDTFAVGKILYQKIYYNSGNTIDSFYQYSTDSVVAIYNLSFTNVGQSNGNYVPDLNGVNGNVYDFVSPVAGVKQGSYEPVALLITPKKQQIISVGIDYSVNKNTTLKSEVAMSDYNPNTFSTVSNSDHLGYASKFQLNNNRLLSEKDKLMLISSLDIEYVQAKFKPIEVLRSVEFSRDWGLSLTPLPATETIITATTGLKNNKNFSLTYQFMNYRRTDDYNGIQNSLLHKFNWKGWVFNNQFVVTNFTNLNDHGVFLRPTFDVSKLLKEMNNWHIGFNYSLQNNATRNIISDTLTPLAFSFHTYSVYLKSNEKKKNHYNITFTTQTNKYPVNKDFVRGDRSYNLNLQTELLANPKRKLYLNATFRKLKVYDSTISNQKDDETILGRAEYVMKEWKGLLTGNILYEVGSGQEQQRNYSYLEVPAGTGQYTWIDYNKDGIQQLNEFELAAFSDQANFIRIFTPTDNYIKANYTTLNYSFNITPRALLNQKELKGVKKFVSKLNLLSSLQINKKSIAKGDFEVNPFAYSLSDTSLITLTAVMVNTLSFNRLSSKWGLDLSNLRNNSRSFLTYGYESRIRNNWTLKWRWNISRTFSMNINTKKSLSALYTPQFENQNYQLSIYTIQPQVTYIKGTLFRLTAGYIFDNENNLPLYGGEKSTSHSLDLETKYNVLQNSSITAKFTFNEIIYNSATNTTASYIMLNGLLPGSNYLWSISYNKRLLNNLELTMQYDGRKPASSNIVHTGRASITALF